jgi:hypothetical protein
MIWQFGFIIRGAGTLQNNKELHYDQEYYIPAKFCIGYVLSHINILLGSGTFETSLSQR